MCAARPASSGGIVTWSSRAFGSRPTHKQSGGGSGGGKKNGNGSRGGGSATASAPPKRRVGASRGGGSGRSGHGSPQKHSKAAPTKPALHANNRVSIRVQGAQPNLQQSADSASAFAPPPRNPSRRLESPEPDDLTKIFGNISINWYPGHMAAAKQAMIERLSKCHLVLEVRDARIPFSSGNPEFETLFQHKKKILVLNKSDLADPRCFGSVRRYFEARGQPVMMMSGDPFRPRVNPRTLTGPKTAAAVTGVNRAQMRALHALIAQTLGPRKFASVPPVVLVVGLPNTGKSTLINNFRLFGKLGAAANASKRADAADKEETDKMQKGGVAKVGSEPGVTRAISGFLVSSHISSAVSGGTDKLFLLDTPGIMLPYIGSDRRGVELGLKLGAIAALKDLAVGPEVLARFVLWALNRAGEYGYLKALDMNAYSGPTQDLDKVLMAIWTKHFQHTVSNSKLFHDFTRRASQRRRWQERDEAMQRELDDEEMEGEQQQQQQGSQDDNTAAAPFVIAPLRVPLDDAAALAPSSALQLPLPSSSSPLPPPTSVSQLSSEESLLCTSWLIKRFRRGELGRIMLDDIPRADTLPPPKR